MNIVLIIVGASLYLLALFLVANRFVDANFCSKRTKWSKVKPWIWLYILILMFTGPFVGFLIFMNSMRGGVV